MIKHASLFSQLIALFDRQHFHRVVWRHRAERGAKGFSSCKQCGFNFRTPDH